MAEQLRALTALAKSWGLVPRTSGDLTPTSGLRRHLHAHSTYKLMQCYIHAHKMEMKYFLK